MGPITMEVFAEQGAEVIADTSDLTDLARAAALIEETGHIGPPISALPQLKNRMFDVGASASPCNG